MNQQRESPMSLSEALRAGRGDVVSFVGGGGKTTSMFRLAAELSAAGLRVVTTTTTHIREEEVHLAPASVSIDEIEKSLTECLDRHGQCHLVGEPDGKGRVHGASLELIAELSRRADIDAVVVEADGSRSLPFKAPGGHEPVVPENTTILVPVVGINILGQPLDEEHVHRAEIAAALAQVPVGSAITAETVARVLAHPQGGAKQLPAGARLVPLLNKANTEDVVRQAYELAEKLLAYPNVDAVIINSMQKYCYAGRNSGD
jgi:molybdenum cofactor cytidylyltransferase